MGEGRLKFHPLSKPGLNRRLNHLVNFGGDSDQSQQYHERIKRIMKKLKEISVRIDKLASQM